MITGGTGLVGKALTEELLQKGYAVIILTRNLKDTKPQSNVEYALWDVNKKMIDVKALQKADAIIHLAGAGVADKKWTAKYKQEIIDSRVKSSELIIETLKTNVHKVKVIVSASAIGWYGTDKIPGHYFTENEGPDADFLGEVCRLWEESTVPAEAMGIRVCRLRTGIVLANEGGAYKEFKAPLKFGIASILGSGKQTVSWIHIEDLCRAYLFAIENENMSGSFNAVSPAPVTNKTLVLEMAKAAKGKAFIPVHVPEFVLKIMLGARSIEVLKSTTVSSNKIKQAGFQFIYPSITAAVNELEHKKD